MFYPSPQFIGRRVDSFLFYSIIISTFVCFNTNLLKMAMTVSLSPATKNLPLQLELLRTRCFLCLSGFLAKVSEMMLRIFASPLLAVTHYGDWGRGWGGLWVNKHPLSLMHVIVCTECLCC